MLKHLSVARFAVIENIEVSFEQGMNVLTGETGAGKSLLIDAIGLLLGERASSDLIRSGCDDAQISALFAPINHSIKEKLIALDLPINDDELLITRKIKANSGSVIKINGEMVTLSILNQLSEHLADIHTQHDAKRLFNPSTYVDMIDHYDDQIMPLKDAYLSARDAYLQAHKRYATLQAEQHEISEKIDMLQYQQEELERHDLVVDEETHIEERLQVLQNFDQVFQSVKQAHQLLDETSATDHVYDAAKTLETGAEYDEHLKDYAHRIESAYYELDDIKAAIYDTLSTMDFDPDELEQLETRKHTLDTLKRKYRMDINDLIEHQETIKATLDELTHYDDTLEKAQAELKAAYDTVLKKAKSLSAKRKSVAKTIRQLLKDELKALELKNVQFDIVFAEHDQTRFDASEQFTAQGIDHIDFLISPNIGETLKPLRKIASGGELSRIMLALKTIFANNKQLNLMIFDEIDSGVSGYVASQVSKKMKQIAINVQVIAITHLPQVAAAADHHYHIEKTQVDNRTKTSIRTLNDDERVQAIAAMISSDEVNEHALKSAKALLK